MIENKRIYDEASACRSETISHLYGSIGYTPQCTQEEIDKEIELIEGSFIKGAEWVQKEMLKDILSCVHDKKEVIIASLKSAIKDLNDIQGASDADDNKMVDVACKLRKLMNIIENIRYMIC